MPPPVIIWWRCFLATFIIGAFCKFKKIGFRIDFKKHGGAILLSGLLMGGHWVTYFFALRWSTAAIGTLALFTYPVITALLEPFFFKTKFNPVQIALALLIVLGIYLLAPEISLENEHFQGILIGIFSALLYSLRNIIMKKKVAQYHGSTLMFYQLLIISIFLMPVLWFYDDLQVQEYLPYLALLALIPTAIGHTGFVIGLKNFNINSASIISSIQPIWSMILGILILKEIPSLSTIIGGLLIVSTVLFESLRSFKK